MIENSRVSSPKAAVLTTQRRLWCLGTMFRIVDPCFDAKEDQPGSHTANFFFPPAQTVK